MSQQQQFMKVAEKLSIHSTPICRKAQELDRLCQVRCSGGGLASLSFTGSCRTVLCLDLAATSQGERLDQKLAIKLSGLTSTSYKSTLKTLQRLLELEENYSLQDIAVKFGCSEAVTKAQEMLSRYREEFEVTTSNTTKEDDDDDEFDRPLFSCSALYAACRQLKIKVDKPKIIEMAGIKRSAFDKLVTKLQNLVQEPPSEKSSRASKRSKNWLDDIEELADKEDLQRKRKTLERESKDDEEDYEEWKRKILAATESCDDT